jgi:hypothetical protein
MNTVSIDCEFSESAFIPRIEAYRLVIKLLCSCKLAGGIVSL